MGDRKAELSIAIIIAAALPFFAFAACVGTACTTSTRNTPFTQDLYVNGTVTKGSGSFVIDRLDPKTNPSTASSSSLPT